MGSSIDYTKVRHDKLELRNKEMVQFIVIFKQIISKTGLSQSGIERIIRSDLVEIVRLLNIRQITSQQLVAIYGLRAATLGKDLCNITEHYFNYALKKAKECDEERLKSGKLNCTIDDQWNQSKHFPVLFGVPTSIKDNIQMQGTAATVGLSARAFKIDKVDSPMVVCIKNNGMIPFIKTNLPQLAFNFDSNNFLWGRCLNPWNINKSAGGSSGGQGSAIASGVSPIGIGNDMGGSIRIPAHFCGISGLMPSAHRLPGMRCFTQYSQAFSGKDTVTGVSGPMGTSIDSLALWMKAMTTEQYYKGQSDPYVKLIPFDFKVYKQTQTSTSKLRIGYFKHLQFIQCSPACARALQETVAFLKKDHQLVEIKIPFEREVICALYSELLGEGGFQALSDMLEGQKLVSEYGNLATLAELNCCMFGLAQCVINKTQPRMGIIINSTKKMTTYQYMRMVGRVKELRQVWIDYWRAQKLDFVVCPGFGMQAPYHGMSGDGSLVAAYTLIWNVLAMPVASTPITVVREDEQKYESVWDDDITKAVKKSVVDSVGLPVGIQVVGIPFQEEKILGLAKKIEGHFKFYQKHPLPINVRIN